MDVGDRQLMGQIVDVLHALLHLGQLLLKQLRQRTIMLDEREEGGGGTGDRENI